MHSLFKKFPSLIHKSPVFNFARQVFKKPILIPNEQRSILNQDIKKEKLTFNSIQGINYHLETYYPINDNLWIKLLNQILLFNKVKIIEVSQQELFNESLNNYLKNSKTINDKIIQLTCEMCIQYKKHNCDYAQENRQFLFDILGKGEDLSLNTLLKISNLVNYYLANNPDLLLKNNSIIIKNISNLVIANPDDEIEFDSLKEIYNLVDYCRKENILYDQRLKPIIEDQLIRFANAISKPMLLKVFQNLSYTSKKYNNDVIGVLINRSSRLIHEMTTNEIITINNKLNDLKITDSVWFTLVTKYSIELIDKLEQTENQKQILPEDYELLRLSESLSGILLNPQCLQTAIDSYVEIEGYFINRFSQLTSQNQLVLVKQHSLLLEALYRQQQEIKDLSKRGPKKVQGMNIRFYELIIDQLKELNFTQTVQFLEYASVLGITKRKVCQQIIKKGLEGLVKYDLREIDENTGYILLNYYKLMRMFITSEEEIIQIDLAFSNINVNVIQLLTDYGHYAIRRDKIENSIKMIE